MKEREIQRGMREHYKTQRWRDNKNSFCSLCSVRGITCIKCVHVMQVQFSNISAFFWLIYAVIYFKKNHTFIERDILDYNIRNPASKIFQ